MSPLERFLDPAFVSLKICGVTTRGDAERLVALGVDALGREFLAALETLPRSGKRRHGCAILRDGFCASVCS